ncbi:MAG: TonB-dependent receptor [Gammaproteobacteria bacterium]|nr:TonB-dependent receptor [Gammaproteobacteria bacterium]
MKSLQFAHVRASILAICAASLTIPVYAQELEEIVVVARKREESLQEVPISITTFNAEDLRVQGIDSLEDIARQSAGIIFDKGFSPQDTRVVMRGLSPTRGRPNVAVLLDDVDISSEGVRTSGSSLTVNPRLIDIERIEIVRGPQSALYGRSAFGGAIHYVTRRPGAERRGQLSVDVSAEGKREVTGSASGPLSDNFFVGFNFAAWNEEGYYQNTVTGGDVGGQQGVGFTLTGALDVGERARFTARFEYTDDEFEPAAAAASDMRVAIPTPASGLGVIWHPDATSVDQPFGPVPKLGDAPITLSPDPRTGEEFPGTTREVLRGQLRAEFDFAGAMLTSITHVGSVDAHQFHDSQRIGDVSAPVPPFGISVSGEVNFVTENDLFSQEFRLTSTGEGPFSWVLGGLYWTEEYQHDEYGTTCINYGFMPPFFSMGVPNFRLRIDCGYWVARIGSEVPRHVLPWNRDVAHTSAYGLVDWQFSEAWDMGLEARYVSEELDMSGPSGGTLIGNAFGPFTQFPPEAHSISAEEDDSYLAPKVTLRYRPSDEQTYYGSVSQAIKPAGISTLVGPEGFNPDVLRFEAEKMTVYEFGWKTSWMDNRLRFNGAAFYQDFTDKQLTTQYQTESGNLATRPENASAALIKGIEVDVEAVLTDNLTMQWGYTWLSAEYDEYNKLSSSLNDAVRGGSCEPVTLGGTTTCLVDLTGNEIEDVPTHQLFAGLSWRSGLANGAELMIDFDVQYQGSRWMDEWNMVEFESYMLADIRVGLSRDSWTVMAYVENLFDDDTMRSGVSAPDFGAIGFVSGFVPPPRVPPPGRFFFTLLFPNALTLHYPDPREFGVRASYTF